jgi:hypothetical protein
MLWDSITNQYQAASTYQVTRSRKVDYLCSALYHSPSQSFHLFSMGGSKGNIAIKAISPTEVRELKYKIPDQTDILCQEFQDDKILLNGCRNGRIHSLDLRSRQGQMFQRESNDRYVVNELRYLDRYNQIVASGTNAVSTSLGSPCKLTSSTDYSLGRSILQQTSARTTRPCQQLSIHII